MSNNSMQTHPRSGRWWMMVLLMMSALAGCGSGSGLGPVDRVAHDPTPDPILRDLDPDTDPDPVFDPDPDPIVDPDPEPTPSPTPAPDPTPVGDGVAGCDADEQVFRFLVPPEHDPRHHSAAAIATQINRQFNHLYCMQLVEREDFTDTTEWDRFRGTANDIDFTAIDHTALVRIWQYAGHPKYQLFDLPFLFTSGAALDEFLDSTTARTNLAASLEVDRAVLLGYWRQPMLQFAATGPIVEPNHLAGRKIALHRFAPTFYQRYLHTSGAALVRLDDAELSTALQTGVVDGLDIRIDRFEDLATAHLLDGLTMTHHRATVQLVIIQQSTWQRLPTNHREEIGRIIHKVSAEHRAQSAQQEREARARLVARGVPVRTLSDAQRLQWQQAARLVWQEATADVPADYIDAALHAGNADESLLLIGKAPPAARQLNTP